MHVVLIHRYFHPDSPPYAEILLHIATELVEQGHRVTVLTCQPSYDPRGAREAPRVERIRDGLEVRRVDVVPDRSTHAAKLVNLARLAWHIHRSGKDLRDADVVMAATTPPIGLAWAARMLARRVGAKFVYHKQDIWPEVQGKKSGLRGRVVRALRWVDIRNDRSASRIVVLSEDMASTEHARGIAPSMIEVINNFDPWGGPVASSERPERRTSDPLRVVFAGSLGRFQNVEMVVAAMGQFRGRDDIVFDFFGDGALRPAIEELAASSDGNIRAHGFQSPTVVADFLSSTADVGIVSLADGVIRSAYPSRTLSYLKNGCPVVAIVESDSELARTVETLDIGAVVRPGDIDGLVRTLDALVTQNRTGQMRKNVQREYEAAFGKQAKLGDWVRMFHGLGSAR